MKIIIIGIVLLVVYIIYFIFKSSNNINKQYNDMLEKLKEFSKIDEKEYNSLRKSFNNIATKNKIARLYFELFSNDMYIKKGNDVLKMKQVDNPIKEKGRRNIK